MIAPWGRAANECPFRPTFDVCLVLRAPKSSSVVLSEQFSFPSHDLQGTMVHCETTEQSGVRLQHTRWCPSVVIHSVVEV